MVNMTLAVPEELNTIMKQHTEIKWSEIARRAMWAHAKKLELMENLAAESRLTEKDAEDIGHKIKAGLHKRYFQ